MLPFLHDRLQRWQVLLLACNKALEKLGNRDLDLETAVSRFLTTAIDTQRQLQRADAENRLLALQAEYSTALGGVHPMTLERTMTGRRTMQRSIALHVLTRGGELVRGDQERDRQCLDQARAELERLVLAAWDLGLVEDPSGGEWSQPSLERLWQRVRAAAETASAARGVQARVNTVDIVLLLSDILAALRPVP